jgi:hypothetical protein
MLCKTKYPSQAYAAQNKISFPSICYAKQNILSKDTIHNFRDCCCHLYISCSAMQRYMIRLAYPGDLCTKLDAAGRTCWFLRSFIWSHVSGLMRFRDGSDRGKHQILSKFRKKDPGNDRQAFGEESMSRTRGFEWHARYRAERKGETGVEQS